MKGKEEKTDEEEIYKHQLKHSHTYTFNEVMDRIDDIKRRDRVEYEQAERRKKKD